MDGMQGGSGKPGEQADIGGAGRFWKQTIPGAALGTRDFVIALARRPLRMVYPCDWCDRSFWDDSLWGKQWLCLRNGGHSHG